MRYIQNYKEFVVVESKGGPFTKKLKNPEYMMTMKEVLTFLPNDMPEDLIKFILSWKNIKKSPYGQTWYSAPKSWSGFIDGEYRVADHWNFEARGKIHCRTIQDPNTVSNQHYWYVGQFHADTENYDIIKKYPKESGREYLLNLRKEYNKNNGPDEAYIEKWRQFSNRINNGEVKAQLGDGTIVTVIKRKNSMGDPSIRYMKGNLVITTKDYKLIDEIVEK